MLKTTWIHVKYTCQPTENSLDELGIPKNPYFDPSHDSIASFSRILEGGHSMPPIRTALICIPSDKGLTLSGQLLPLILLQLANGTRKVSSSLSTHEPPTSCGALQKNTDFTNPLWQ